MMYKPKSKLGRKLLRLYWDVFTVLVLIGIAKCVICHFLGM